MSNNSLFQSFTLHDITLPNRIVLAPMTRSRAGKERIPNLLMAEYYAQRSAAGLLITEATTISEEANGWNESPGVYKDEMVEGWKHVVNAVHDKGGVIFLQLWHLGRASHSSFHDGKPAVAPSPIKINEDYIHTPTGKQPHEVPRALDTDEIPRVVADYPYPEYAAMGQFVYDVKGVQEGFNEMLQFNSFLRRAKPMTYDVPGQQNELGPQTATWSGMIAEDKALVRTISFNGDTPVTKTV